MVAKVTTVQNLWMSAMRWWEGQSDHIDLAKMFSKHLLHTTLLLRLLLEGSRCCRSKSATENAGIIEVPPLGKR
jgi:hypothetical protein